MNESQIEGIGGGNVWRGVVFVVLLLALLAFFVLPEVAGFDRAVFSSKAALLALIPVVFVAGFVAFFVIIAKLSKRGTETRQKTIATLTKGGTTLKTPMPSRKTGLVELFQVLRHAQSHDVVGNSPDTGVPPANVRIHKGDSDSAQQVSDPSSSYAEVLTDKQDQPFELASRDLFQNKGEEKKGSPIVTIIVILGFVFFPMIIEFIRNIFG